MRVGYVQTSPHFGEKEQNFEQVGELTQDLQVDLVVLPELFATGYTFASHEEVVSLAEDDEGETAQFLRRLAERLKAVIVGGFVEVADTRYYNASMMVDSGGVLSVYRKIHLFNREKVWFSPGDRPFEVCEVRGARIGMMICFDWIFPEAARSLALLGAEVIAHPANLVLPYCQAAMVTRCLENRLFAVTANRIGTETRGQDSFTFTGASQITSSKGRVLSSAPSDRCHSAAVEIDLEEAREKRINSFNHTMEDRRTAFYRMD